MATLIQAFLGAAGPTLSMSGYTRLVLCNTISAFILNFGLNIWLIPQYGIIGAAMATLISLTAVGIARVIEVGIILRMSFINKKSIKPILAGTITYGVLLSIKPSIMAYHTLITLMMAGITSVLIFGILIWIMKIDVEDKEFLSGLGILKGLMKRQ